jgi:hypothetical protein
VYVRISILRPRPNEGERVGQLLRELTTSLATQPGYVRGMRLEAEARELRAWPAGFPSGLLGRVSIWDTEEDADRAAQTAQVESLRGQLNSLVVDHHEYAFLGSDVPVGTG